MHSLGHSETAPDMLPLQERSSMLTIYMALFVLMMMC